MSDEVEQMIQDKGLNAPRITPERIEDVIAQESFYIFPGSQLTACVLTLNNGFTVSGESACASPENFDEEVGRKIARDNAKNKIWALEGYLLKQSLFEMEDGHLTRLQQEFNELDERTHKLDSFINESDIFANLSSRGQHLMVSQLTAMIAYRDCLRQRLAL